MFLMFAGCYAVVDITKYKILLLLKYDDLILKTHTNILKKHNKYMLFWTSENDVALKICFDIYIK